MNRHRIAAWALGLAVATSTAQAQTTGLLAVPVEFASALTLGGKTLALNGFGSRYKAVFRVDDAALYAGAPVRTVEELLAQDGPKSLRLLARRDIPASELGKMLLEGITASNPRDEVMRHLMALAQVGGMFGSRSQIASGESFGFQYLPTVGTQLMVNDKVVGEPVRDPAFFGSMMRVWLGQRPVDDRLRAALLGLPTTVAALHGN